MESERSWLPTVVILTITKVVFFSDFFHVLVVNKVLILTSGLVCRTHIMGIRVCVSKSARAQSISRKSHKLAYLQIKDTEFYHCYLQPFLFKFLLRFHRISITTMLSVFPWCVAWFPHQGRRHQLNFRIRSWAIRCLAEGHQRPPEWTKSLLWSG